MGKHIKVAGHSNLVRDLNSGAILNINKKSIEDARNAKRNRQEREQRLDRLENEMADIKNLLLQLVNNND